MNNGFSRKTFSWKNVLDAKPLVGNLIAMDRRVAGNDILCLLQFWRNHDEIHIPESVFYDILKNGTNPEIIFRARRKVSEEKRKAYGVTSEVEEKRLERAQVTRSQVKQATF